MNWIDSVSRCLGGEKMPWACSAAPRLRVNLSIHFNHRDTEAPSRTPPPTLIRALLDRIGKSKIETPKSKIHTTLCLGASVVKNALGLGPTNASDRLDAQSRLRSRCCGQRLQAEGLGRGCLMGVVTVDGGEPMLHGGHKM